MERKRLWIFVFTLMMFATSVWSDKISSELITESKLAFQSLIKAWIGNRNVGSMNEVAQQSALYVNGIDSSEHSNYTGADRSPLPVPGSSLLVILGFLVLALGTNKHIKRNRSRS